MELKDVLEKYVGWQIVKAQAARVPQLEARIRALEERLGMPNTATLVCDNCGSPDLTRAGSRPHAIFGKMGTKEALYRCNGCGSESAFIID